MLGAALNYRGDKASSIKAFEQSVRFNPKDPGALGNLGILYAQQNQPDKAAQYYESALKLNPGLIDTLYNLAITYQKMGERQKAKQLLERLLKIRQNHPAAHSALGLIFQDEDDDQNALIHYDKCLVLNPDSVIALHNKSIILRRQRNYREAVALAIKAGRLGPAIGDIHQNLGSCYAVTGEIDLAIAAFEKALELEPLNVSHHHWFNQLLWNEGRKEFLSSYYKVINSAPDSHHLRRELVYKLDLANRLEEAAEHSEYLLDKDFFNPMNSKLYGAVLRKQRKFEEAVKLHLQANQLAPEDLSYQQELAISYLACGDAVAAMPLINQLIAKNKVHQGYIALKATALRITESDEYYDLCNYEKLVLRTKIEPPSGYSSLAEFNQELASYLSEQHTSKEHPLDQSLVNGTQTIDDLFENPNRVVKQLKDCFDEQMYRFLKQLPVDDLHPTLSRNHHDFTYTGAWSVMLRSSGFHKNHFHSHGWYSGPYYVELPDVIQNEEDKQGWVKFGEPSFESVVPLPPDLVVKPEEGLMVRFPSFMWHGTTPFKSEETRLVVALDLAPR